MGAETLEKTAADFRATITAEVLRHRGDKPDAFERAVRDHESRFLSKLDSIHREKGADVTTARDFVTRYAADEIQRTNALGVVELAA